MNMIFKVTTALLSRMRSDLARPHGYASERVGFVSAGLDTAGDNLLILARDYRPVEDKHYLADFSVGAMMGPYAINSALQWVMDTGSALFHVHMHGGRGVPRFSEIDLAEQAKFVPCFFNVAPKLAHGAIVLSDEAATGRLWTHKRTSCRPIEEFFEVGAPMRKWTGA